MKLWRSRSLAGAAASFALVVAVGIPRHGFAQTTPTQAREKRVRDHGEYDLFAAAAKEVDSRKKLQILNEWKQQYPDSDYREDREMLILQTHLEDNRAAGVYEAARNLLTLNPKHVHASYWVAKLVPELELKEPRDLDLGEQAARELLATRRPAGTREADWGKARKDLEALAYRGLGYVAMTRNQFEPAEREFCRSLELRANQAQVSWWLGTVIFRRKQPERTGEVLFHFARAAVLDPKTQGGLTPQATREAVETYLANAYTQYHGEDSAGFAKLKADAAQSPFPPPGFRIEDLGTIEARKHAEFAKNNPQLALWRSIRRELGGAAGEQYFAANLKDAMVPRLKGTLISARPAVNPKELTVGIEKPDVPEVTLILDVPLKGRPRPGAIEWEGVATAFTKAPFMLVFRVEKGKLFGVAGENPEAQGLTGNPRRSRK